MRQAIICGKWKLPITVPLGSEAGLPKQKRSYLHYISEHGDLVAAKCLATEWLLSSVERAFTVREYFGGVGIVSTIVRNLLAPHSHIISELSAICVEQLKGAFTKKTEVVRQQDARQAMLGPEECRLHILDFPTFTLLHAKTKWSAQLASIFSTRAPYVILTDTAASYIHVTKKRYSEVTGADIKNMDDYTMAFSCELHKAYGYSITRAAYRGRNAAYYLLQPGLCGTIVSTSFPVRGSEHAFIIE